MGGNLKDVTENLQLIEQAAEDLGLVLNLSKSETIFVDGETKSFNAWFLQRTHQWYTNVYPTEDQLRSSLCYYPSMPPGEH
jgi:hypothetical protein